MGCDGAVGVDVAGHVRGGEDGGGECEGKDGEEGNERGHGWWGMYKGLTGRLYTRERRRRLAENLHTRSS